MSKLFLPKDKAPKLHNLGSFWTGFTNHFINIEMVIFYIVIISQLSSRDVTTSIQLMIATEMALFTAIWFILISHLTGKIPNKDKVLDSLAIRITFGLLFLMSAVTLIKIT